MQQRHLFALVFLLPFPLLTPACKPKSEAAKSELSEAGYQFTTDGWFQATRENDTSAMKKFLANGFDPLTADPSGDSALHIAAANGAQEAADLLLSRGISIDHRGTAERTPLMSAVIGNQTSMVKWLLRQGADPLAQDQEGYIPLMIAVRESAVGPLAELAPYNRDDLDKALLVASLMGNSPAIDALTNYGASVYARMPDGRTPLMLAAQNGHLEASDLLVEIGASRLAIDADGRTAADLATDAGHQDIAALINRDPLPDELALNTPEQIADEMERFVDEAAIDIPTTDDAQPTNPETSDPDPTDPAPTPDLAANETDPSTEPAAPENPSRTPWNAPIPGQGGGAFGDLPPSPTRQPAVPLAGKVIGRPTTSDPTPDLAGQPTPTRQPLAANNTPDAPEAAQDPENPTPPSESITPPATATVAPPLVMRHYRQRELPIEVRTVEAETATILIAGPQPREIKVREGQTIPNSRLVVVKLQRRMQDLKDSSAGPVEVSVVELRDSSTGSTRELISGVPSAAHDPIALVEDTTTGQRYTATTGQRFRSIDGTEFLITDVRPNQLVIEDTTNGTVQTIQLRGPRG